MHARLPEGNRFARQELEILARACALADREAKLRSILDHDGFTTRGSRGQVVLHPAVSELRLVEGALLGLLLKLDLSDTTGEIISPTVARARKAATTRWNREHDELAAKREAAGL
jgi:hypothetical protein